MRKKVILIAILILLLLVVLIMMNIENKNKDEEVTQEIVVPPTEMNITEYEVTLYPSLENVEVSEGDLVTIILKNDEGISIVLNSNSDYTKYIDGKQVVIGTITEDKGVLISTSLDILVELSEKTKDEQKGLIKVIA